MASRPVAAMNEAVARQILRDAAAEMTPDGPPLASIIAVQLADNLLDRGGWKANTAKPLLRAYEVAKSVQSNG